MSIYLNVRVLAIAISESDKRGLIVKKGIVKQDHFAQSGETIQAKIKYLLIIGITWERATTPIERTFPEAIAGGRGDSGGVATICELKGHTKSCLHTTLQSYVKAGDRRQKAEGRRQKAEGRRSLN